MSVYVRNILWRYSNVEYSCEVNSDCCHYLRVVVAFLSISAFNQEKTVLCATAVYRNTDAGIK